MPYAIRKNRDGSVSVVNAITGKEYAKHTSRRKAEAQVRLLRMKEAGR